MESKTRERKVIQAGSFYSSGHGVPAEQPVLSYSPRMEDGLGKAATASGGSELTGHSSSQAQLTNPSPEATLPPAKPSPVWPHGLNCSARDNQSEVNQHSRLGEQRHSVQEAEPRAGWSQERPPPCLPHHLLLRGKC